jgi:hypothetical protein
MSTTDDRPVIVTGEQHDHPAIRLLARACIALAQEQLGNEQAHEDPRDTDESARQEATPTGGAA